MECNKLNIPEHWHRNLDGSYDIIGNACITKEYFRWIPRNPNITHINLTPEQKKALLEMQILQL